MHILHVALRMTAIDNWVTRDKTAQITESKGDFLKREKVYIR